MRRNPGLLVLLVAAILLAVGGLTTLTTAPLEAPNIEKAVQAPPAADAPSNAACDDAQPASDASHPDKVPPGCCTTQCTVNKDCDKICGKGNCACIQESSCCRRCVY